MGSETVDAVILTYKPDERFLKILDMLEKQTLRPGRIIVMNTEEKYLEDLLHGRGEPEDQNNLEIHHILKREFNHGMTRNIGAGYSKADYLIFMTQDAVPADSKLVENLVSAAGEEGTAVSYARQLPAPGCGPVERYNRAFNYPPRDMVKGRKDLPKYGIKTYFCSNVCACYRRSVFDELGGFIRDTIFNEDMIYAAGAVQAGYLIRYASGAQVYHSHDYSVSEQYHRNFDLGVSQADHPEVFEAVSSEKEGGRLVKGCIGYLGKEKKLYLLLDFLIKCAARYIGYKRGRNYRRLSRRAVLKATTDPGYFIRKWEKDPSGSSPSGLPKNGKPEE